MIRFEQSALDAAYAAKRALERAIANYEACKNHPALTVDDGPLFATVDNIKTARMELKAFRDMAETDTEIV